MATSRKPAAILMDGWRLDPEPPTGRPVLVHQPEIAQLSEQALRRPSDFLGQVGQVFVLARVLQDSHQVSRFPGNVTEDGIVRGELGQLVEQGLTGVPDFQA